MVVALLWAVGAVVGGGRHEDGQARGDVARAVQETGEVPYRSGSAPFRRDLSSDFRIRP